MNPSRTARTALLATMAFAMTVGSMTANARPGSVSSSRSSSVSAPARSAPAMASTSTRAGSGTNSGMSRASVMTSARQQSPANVASQPAPSRNYAQGGGSNYNGNSGYNNAPAPAAAPASRGFSGGQLAGAAAAGAVGGYLLHGATQPNQPVIVNNGAGGAGYGPSGAAAGYAPAGGGGYAPAPAYGPAYAGSSGGMGVFGFLVILALLGAGGYFLYRKFGTPATTGQSGMGSYSAAPTPAPRASAFAATPSTSTSPNMTIENDLLNSAPQSFRGVQDAYSRNDRFAVAALVDDAYLGQFTADMTADAGNPATVVHSVKVVGGQVLGFERQDSRYVGSIHYQADISEGNGPSQEIEEVWHFVRPIEGGSWKLAGIEQV